MRSVPERTSLWIRCRIAVICGLLAVGAAHGQPQEPEWKKMPILPIPRQPDKALDPARVELGQRLFFDARLSSAGKRSCADCHPLERNGVDGLARAIAYDGKRRLRNTPTVFNASLSLFLNWDGGFSSLTELFEKVIVKDTLMANTWPNLLASLGADPQYVAAFQKSYPGQGISKQTVLDAMVNFQLSLTTPDSRFDRYLRGEKSAISAREQAGYQLFKSYGCVSCHQGVNIGGNLLQVFGVFPGGFARDPIPPMPPSEADHGRFELTGSEDDLNVFRVPSLRNVAVTAPYFHDGRAATLDDAVRTMALVQMGRKLDAGEIRLIVEFLGTLTGEYRGKPLRAPMSGSR